MTNTQCIHRTGCPKPGVCHAVGHCTSMTETDVVMDTQVTAMVSKSWRCFHCDDVFTSEVDARCHFGSRESSEPACRIKDAGEFALLQALRNAEDELAGYRAEDSDILRSMWAMKADHAVALRREEEKGYARALKDTNYQEPALEPGVAFPDQALRGMAVYADEVPPIPASATPAAEQFDTAPQSSGASLWPASVPGTPGPDYRGFQSHPMSISGEGQLSRMSIEIKDQTFGSAGEATGGAVSPWVWKYGVIHFHGIPGFAERLMEIVIDCQQASVIADIWLNDFGQVLKEFGYDMTITRAHGQKANVVHAHGCWKRMSPSGQGACNCGAESVNNPQSQETPNGT